MEPLIKVEQLAFSYNGSPVLAGVNALVNAGDLLAIAGPNGSGKSTLLRLMSGYLRPASGAALLLGTPAVIYPKAELAKVIAYVPSEIYLPYEFSVGDIAIMGRSPYVSWWRDYDDMDRAKAYDALKEVGITDLMDRSINSLSSGERQLAFIAQALAQEPKALLLDEPTSHLDINYKIRIFELLSRLVREKNMAVAIISHDLHMLGEYASHALLLKKGGTVFFGPSKDGFAAQHISAAYGIADRELLRKFGF